MITNEGGLPSMKQEETLSSLSVDPQFESEKISESQPQPTSQSTEKTEPKVETESEGNPKPPKKARVKRPFGSIRCRSVSKKFTEFWFLLYSLLTRKLFFFFQCNRYGITAKCPCSPSARYAVMIQSKVINYREFFSNLLRNFSQTDFFTANF